MTTPEATQTGNEVAEYYDLMSKTDKGAIEDAIERARRKAERREALVLRALDVLKTNKAGDVLWKEQQ